MEPVIGATFEFYEGEKWLLNMKKCAVHLRGDSDNSVEVSYSGGSALCKVKRWQQFEAKSLALRVQFNRGVHSLTTNPPFRNPLQKKSTMEYREYLPRIFITAVLVVCAVYNAIIVFYTTKVKSENKSQLVSGRRVPNRKERHNY